MKTSLLFLSLMLLTSLSSFSKVWTITNTGASFNPSTLTIIYGDTVNFQLGSTHNVLEVSQSDWNLVNANALSGGFSLPLGGGQILSVNLSLGTHYYLSTPDVGSAMEGRIVVQPAPATLQWSKPADIVYGTALSASQLNATANTSGTYEYTPALGTSLNAGSNQTLSVKFTPADMQNFNTATMSVKINVLKADPVISWSKPADIIYGTLLTATQFNPTTQNLGAFTYSPIIGSTMEPGDNQTISATFTPSDFNNYNTITTINFINVKPQTPVISWAQPSNIYYGTKLSSFQLNAGANTAGSFVYNPTFNTLLLAGNDQTLEADFTPTDAVHYTTASKIITFSVLKALANLSWTNPSSIVYGTPLSSTQLNGTSDGIGTVTFDPPAGTVVDAGDQQTLTMHFVPVDQQNYAIVSKSVFLKVAKAGQTVNFTVSSPLVYGTSETLSAQGLGNLVYTVQSGSATISNSNILTANSGIGSCVIRATASGDNNHSVAFEEATVSFQKASQSITFLGNEHTTISTTSAILQASSSSGLPVSLINSNNTIASITGTTVTFTSAGATTIEADQAGDDNYLPATSVIHTISYIKPNVTSVSLIESMEIGVYPNPFSNELTIETPFENLGSASLFDSFGRKVMSFPISQTITKINVENLPTGIYLLQISNNNQLANVKLIKR